MNGNGLKSTALQLCQAGLSVLPAHRLDKRPAVPAWKVYQTRRADTDEMKGWFETLQDAVCIIAGAVSGHLEMIDFDFAGQFFAPWKAKVVAAMPGLLERLVMETTQSGGWHVVYRSQSPVDSSMKLAQRRIPVRLEEIFLKDGKEYVRLCGKDYAVRTDPQGRHVIGTYIETRGEGGVFLCTPTAGYAVTQGSFLEIPVLTAQERDILLMAAWELNEYYPQAQSSYPVACQVSKNNTLRPGDDYDLRGDVRSLLQSHGWRYVYCSQVNEYWCRPGKKNGWSASLRTSDRRFYVFSSNAWPFEPNQDYRPFAVYTLLEHQGDFTRAARVLAEQGYGDKDMEPVLSGVDISGILGHEPEDEPQPCAIQDPGPLPKHLLDVPGLIHDVADFMLQTAPHPEPILSFLGALCLQAFLAGRKVRDSQDNRTNLYILGLAYPGCGKDHPRKVNARILYEAGLTGVIADGFASGEGIEDKMFLGPTMLFQTDEIDSLITATSKGKDGRADMISNVLLKFFSACNSIYQTRLKAGNKDSNTIDQPSLNIYGTAVPENYYQALSSKMLTNGFFARMLVIEAGPRTPEQDAPIIKIPDSIRRTAKTWVDFMPGEGNLANFHPIPIIVTHTDIAKTLQREYGRSTDAQYDAAQAQADLVTMAIWGRASEKARRLALIYACSENPIAPQITEPAVRWATELVDYTTHRMLFMASQHVSESAFHANCQRLIRVLSDWKAKKGDDWMPFWLINRKLPWTQREHEEVRTTLLNQRKIDYSEQATGGTPKRLYRITER